MKQKSLCPVGATRLVRFFFIAVWGLTVALLAAASIMNSVAIKRLSAWDEVLRATQTKLQVQQEEILLQLPKNPESSSNAASQESN